MSDELAVAYDPSAAEQTLLRRRRRLRSRIVSFGITVVIVIGLALWPQTRGPGLLVASAVILAISLAWVVAYGIGYTRARRARAEVGAGLALRIGRPGVQVAGVFAPWAEVTGVEAVRGRLGSSARLRLSTITGAQSSVAFDQIDVMPATVDAAVRAYSGSRHGVDLTALDT